jgi:transcriptional regulator of heat shock response
MNIALEEANKLQARIDGLTTEIEALLKPLKERLECDSLSQAIGKVWNRLNEYSTQVQQVETEAALKSCALSSERDTLIAGRDAMLKQAEQFV